MAHLIVFDGERPPMPAMTEPIVPYGSAAYVIGGKKSGKEILAIFNACNEGQGPTALVVEIKSYGGCAQTSEVNRLSDVLRS